MPNKQQGSVVMDPIIETIGIGQWETQAPINGNL